MESMLCNSEFKKQAEHAIRLLSVRAPYVYDEDCGRTRMSRRVQGLLTTSGDRKSHKNVFCYVERGLENRLDPIASFLVFLIRYQKKHGFSESNVVLAGFGGEKDDLKSCPIALRLSSIDNTEPLAKLLCTYSEGEDLKENEPSVIKSYLPNIPIRTINNSIIGGYTPEDIFVIFKTQRKMLMSKRARNGYINKLRKHTAWITIGGDVPFSIEVGTYVPDEWQESEG